VNRPGSIKVDKVVLECKDPETLSGFYCKLLGWVKGYDTGDFIIIGSEDGNIDVGFQKNPDYRPPGWPDAGGGQYMLMHLDFCVAASEH
jgi:catechol-2,3-dioxygenase